MQDMRNCFREESIAKGKKDNTLISVITTIYWILVTAIYLMISLLTKNWKEGWIIWMIAAVLFPAVITVTNVVTNKNNKAS